MLGARSVRNHARVCWRFERVTRPSGNQLFCGPKWPAAANGVVVPNSSPAKSVREFIDFAKSNRGKLIFAFPGAGTVQHLCGELFKRMTAIEMTHMPYRGRGPGALQVKL
jgi:hypothetical protein